ncbi:FMN-binding glutamate synthase family protein, partial [Halomonas sp. MG34]|nr:FMN-binding glutamate synthase family protein [Halomonas sp. MG34]
MDDVFAIILISLLAIVIIVPVFLIIRLYVHDRKQEEHSVLQNYPLLGKMRYILEKMGPELRQYLFNNDREGKPFNRKQFEYVNKAGKYQSSLLGYGAEKDFKENDYYLVNSMLPKMDEEIKVENKPTISTQIYEVKEENLFSRKEKRKESQIKPALLPDEERVILGENTVKEPFYLKGIIGQSAMSYGSLGENAITALSKGLGMAGGTWMNTGEG